jgi:hypothetical protein
MSSEAVLIILRGSFGGEVLIICARAEYESETTGCRSKNARKHIQIIYFHDKGGFLSGFGKLDRFGYLGE